MLSFLVGFVRGIAAMSPIWFVLFLIFFNAGEPKVDPVRLRKYQPGKNKTHF